jgi:DNA mismatch repair protein MutS2
MLDSLTARGGAVVVTTHYEGLKALALADDRFDNASMGFDLSQMSPTFRLAQGVPGSSSALAVARKFGLPVTVIERAETFLSRQDVEFEAVVRKLNDERAALEIARTNALRREEEASQKKCELEIALRAARDREHRKLSKEAEALFVSVRRAREELREVQVQLRSRKLDAGAAKTAEKVLDRIAARVALGGDLEPASLSASSEVAPEGVAGVTSLKRGARVWVPRVRAEAKVLDVLPDGTVRVQAGAMKLVVNATELQQVEARVDERESGKRKVTTAGGDRHSGSPSSDPKGLAIAIQTSDNTCDLRGLRTDDALSLAITFLDRSMSESRGVCFLVHGHGTGALREAIRRELSSSPYVRYFRAGAQSEGGDGVTVVWLS